MEMKEKFPFSCKIFYFSCFMNEVDKKKQYFCSVTDKSYFERLLVVTKQDNDRTTR